MTEKSLTQHVDKLDPGTTARDGANFANPTDSESVEADEAVKVLAMHGRGDEEWTADEEAKVVRKIDRKLVPIMFLTYGLQYYDKAMISQAVCETLPSIARLSWPG